MPFHLGNIIRNLNYNSLKILDTLKHICFERKMYEFETSDI